MFGPRYVYWNAAAWPPADDESAMLFEIAATYLAKLPVTDHFWSTIGSKITPTRGLNAESFATVSPAPFAPLFLSQRSPRFAVRREPTRQLSFTNSECV